MEQLKEEWKFFEYGNLQYRISNYGTIIGLARGRELKQRLNEDGYLMVTLGDMKHRTGHSVHRLVAINFIPNPNNLPEVNHIDTNRQNPRVDNLEWCTHQDNVIHSCKLGNYEKPYFKGENNPNYGNHILSEYYKNNPDIAKEKLSRPGGKNGRATPVNLYDLDYNLVKNFSYIGECCEWLIENGYTKRKGAKVDNLREVLRPYIKNNKIYMDKFYIKTKE